MFGLKTIPNIKKDAVIQTIETPLITRIKQEAEPNNVFYGELIKTIQERNISTEIPEIVLSAGEWR